MRTRNVTSNVAAAFVALALVGAGSGMAATIPFGITNGGIGIHYNNNGGGENPANVAYIKAQFSGTNTNGTEFNFDTTPLAATGGALSWYILFQSVPDQFGVDLVLPATTNDNTNPPPTLIAKENVNGDPAFSTSAGPVTWAINGYQGVAVGPANPAAAVVNSLFRGGNGTGNGVVLTTNTLNVSGTLYTLTVAGELQSDNLIHWYNPATPNSPVGNFELTGKFFFSGSLVYNSAGDTGLDLIDFYAGGLAVTAEVICGTRYVNAVTGSDTLGAIPNNCRNPLTPCKTVAHADDFSCPGDAIVGNAINATQAKLKKDTSTAKDNGLALVKGDFLTGSASGAFNTSGPISVIVDDALTTTQAHTWSTSECVASGTRVTCKSVDKNYQASFRQLGGNANQWKFSIKQKKLAITGPFAGPVTVTLGWGPGIQRSDTISDCKATASGLNCREF